MSNLQLARGQRLHEEAAAELESARDLLRQNTERLNDTRRRMHFITERRVGGTGTASDAGEYAAHQGDEALLAKMLTAAQLSVAQATEKVHGAFVFYTDAQAAHTREQAQERYKALLEQTKQIETVFCQALGALGRAGRAVGISTLGQCFQKSDVLHRALDLNVTPDEEA